MVLRPYEVVGCVDGRATAVDLDHLDRVAELEQAKDLDVLDLPRVGSWPLGLRTPAVLDRNPYNPTWRRAVRNSRDLLVGMAARLMYKSRPRWSVTTLGTVVDRKSDSSSIGVIAFTAATESGAARQASTIC